MIYYRIEHRSEAFDSLVEILETNFGIHVYEDDIAAPERAFIVSNKPIENPSKAFKSFYSESK
ncbi:MAG: hypothetical protein EBQ89_03810 [Alphaproteobacteria bacterium]|nr:hypothetical protein [Alphaproteobacteria bacterium]